MNLLGVDFGKRKIGLALATGPLAEPAGVVKSLKEIARFCQKQKIGRIIMGISEGRIVKEQKKFARELERLTGLPIEFQDEILTTKEAITRMKQIGKKVEKGEEDAFAAALILQDYIDKIKE